MKARVAGARAGQGLDASGVSPRATGPRRLLRAALALLFAGVWQSGCYTESRCQYPTGPCVETGGAAEAAVTAVAAGALWATAGGCNVAGCRPPLVCNTTSGYCNYARCDEGGPPCPPGTRCNSKTSLCQ
ncbi:MAG TPA: hypothetical protein VJU61_07605 [Polyangiaceae bacterium]|nr:hypothetical protein [Polyangiaceae bacterium]